MRPTPTNHVPHENASAEVAAATAAYRVLKHLLPGVRGGARSRLRRRHSPTSRTESGRYTGSASVKTRRLRSSLCDRTTAVMPASRSPAVSTRACGVRRPTRSPRCSRRGSVSSARSCWTRRHRSHWRVPTHSTPTAYAQDFDEVKQYGAKDGSLRTAEQTATALFWSTNVVAQYQAAVRDQVTRRQLDIVDSARAFALLNTSTADALIACWRAKYDARLLASDHRHPTRRHRRQRRHRARSRRGRH